MFRPFANFVLELSQLDTTIGDIEKYFEKLYEAKMLSKELMFLEETCMKKGWKNNVERSIIQLFTINKYQLAAKAVKEAGKAIGLKTSFQVVEEILKSSDDVGAFQNLPLKQVNDDLIRAGESFSMWTAEHIKVLESLQKCGNLLLWLKTNIKSRNDLKTFYDLATISAGESDIEIDRVSHFYQAVSAYAPLILELNTQTCSFAEFQAASNAVFATLATDPQLAEKLVGSNRNLEWVKACKDQQGSVEQSSLKMVSLINQTGIFQIKLTIGSSPSLDKCIRLHYQKVSNETDEGMKRLTLEQLKELNSKLMLITTGTEGKKDVERFSRLLGLIELAGRLFISLLKAGCHIFSQWSLKVCCSSVDFTRE